jgi:cation diffusion facilitator family transporter
MGRNERRTWAVVALTLATMGAEIGVGWWSGSMALLADGWHMASHAGALGVAGLAYVYARRADRAQFVFGTGKVYALSGYTSALALGAVAVAMVGESAARLWAPEVVDFSVALPVAVVGLGVNLASALLLHPAEAEEGHGHDHGHGHGHVHDHGHGHGHVHGHGHGHGHGHDHNLRAAYLHVLADALTSVLAIVALAAGYWWGVGWLDAAVGALGGLVILKWAIELGGQASAELLDRVPEGEAHREVRAAIEALGPARVTDLHIWRLGPDSLAAVVRVVDEAPRGVGEYRAAIVARVPLAHLTVEVHGCPGHRSVGPDLQEA